MNGDTYYCDACLTPHCGTCVPNVCEHAYSLCMDTAAEYCGACRTEIAWDRACVADLDSYRGK